MMWRRRLHDGPGRGALPDGDRIMNKIKRLTKKQARAFFSKQVRHVLGIDAQEYLVRYIQGEFRGDTAKDVRIAMLIPFAR